jgi:hypothetical protein
MSNETYLLTFDTAPEAAAQTDIRVVEIQAHPATMLCLYNAIPQYARGQVCVLQNGAFHQCEYSRWFDDALTQRSIAKGMASQKTDEEVVLAAQAGVRS